MKHKVFNIKLTNVLMKFKADSHLAQRLPLGSPTEEVVNKVYVLVLLEKGTKLKGSFKDTRSTAFIANITRIRPHQNRTPAGTVRSV